MPPVDTEHTPMPPTRPVRKLHSVLRGTPLACCEVGLCGGPSIAMSLGMRHVVHPYIPVVHILAAFMDLAAQVGEAVKDGAEKATEAALTEFTKEQKKFVESKRLGGGGECCPCCRHL